MWNPNPSTLRPCGPSGTPGRVRAPAALALVVGLLAGAACATTRPPCPRPVCPEPVCKRETPPARPAARRAAPARPTAAQAEAWLARTEKKLLDLWIYAERSAWVQANFITYDTNLLAARAEEAVMQFVGEAAREAQRFANVPVSPSVRRRLNLLRLAITLPAPADPKARAELARTAAELKALYGRGRYCLKGGKRGRRGGGKRCLALGELSKILAKGKNPDLMREVWQGWRTVSPPMRTLYARYVRLGNAGARSLGFRNLADLWRSKYDMPPEAFEREVDRLWKQVKPLYQQLHCYVRAKLRKKFGPKIVPEKGPIPAHLLGNMWAQDWSYLYPILAPDRRAKLDLDRALRRARMTPRKMVRYAERFFTSLGLPALPPTFWKRSLFTKPRDRDVVCHASAWDLDWKDDLRIKMCIRVNAEDFVVIHHELGHNYYQRAYNQQPPLFRDSANDGFHEALGDTIALSVTPSYLKKVGLIRRPPKPSLNPLMRRALEKIAFLPFGLLVDKWRWAVFDGRTPPSRYNASWWALRRSLQGVAPPVARSEVDFDPGAKYHIPAGVPYTRYFLAAILQFQFHRALCRIAGHKGPLHTCSIFGSKAAGQRLAAMMAMGLSKPWPEALAALTGERRMDATAILEYFKPLQKWLEKQNRGQTCTW